jgi:tRNA threonylcarbamoyladenosine biosynthesis protein TsaE
MGIDDYLYSGNWCFIEWPEKIESLIPEKCSIINIEILPNGFRKLIYK